MGEGEIRHRVLYGFQRVSAAVSWIVGSVNGGVSLDVLERDFEDECRAWSDHAGALLAVAQRRRHDQASRCAAGW